MLQRCYGCMQELPYSDAPCPHCGYDSRVTSFNRNALEPGTMLRERYILGKTLGLGGFGITYIAWDCAENHPVSVKEFLPSEFATHRSGSAQVQFYSAEGRERFSSGLQKFKEQTAILRRLQDLESINTIYDFVEENGTGYTVMEYLQGQTLKAYLAQYRMLAFADAMNIITPVLCTLDAVHKNGLLHQDICPDNIFLCDDGRVKLLDFGSAQFQLIQNTEGLTIMLKHGYAPIEQYEPHLVAGPWTDVFGAAATLYTMLTGIVPADVLQRRCEDNLRLPSALESDVPPQAEQALMRAMALSPENRYATAEAFLNALDADADSDSSNGHKPFFKKLNLSTPMIAAVTLVVLVIVATVICGVRRTKKPIQTPTQVTSSEPSAALTPADYSETYFENFAPDVMMPIYTADGKQTALPYAAFTKNGKTGVVLTNGEILIPADYSAIVWDETRNALLLDGEVYGTDNAEMPASSLAPDLTQSAYRYDDGLVRVTKGGTSYPIAESDGAFLVQNGGFGVCTRGTLLVDPIYKKATPLSCGIAAFLKDDAWTYRNIYGVDLFGKSFPSSAFSNGVPFSYSEGYVPIFDEETELWGYADLSGKTVVEPKYLFALPPMQGKAWIRTEQGFGVLALTANADDTVCAYCGNDALYVYHPNTGALEISGNGALWDFTPETVPWLFAQTQIRSVYIGGNISYIGANAFRNCTALTDVTIACMPESIGPFAFFGCRSLDVLSLPDSVLSVGEEAFAGCRALDDLSMNGAVRYVGLSAFRDCTVLKTAYFTGGVARISDYAFAGCEQLKQVTIGGTDCMIGTSAFDGCVLLQSVKLPKTASSIGMYAFRNCAALQEMRIPLGITVIQPQTFMGCSALTVLTLPDGLVRIEAEAFSECSSLSGLSLPPTLTTIGERAFYNCRGLDNVMVPSSVKQIDSFAFAGCTGISSFVLDDTVQTLGSNVFNGWTANQTIYVRNALLKKVIGTNAGWDANWSAGSYANIVSK